MPCIIALIVFGILGIFSASHRALAKEALDCVFKRVTFRPCNTGFQDKIKGRILSRVISRSTFWARMVNKHYEILSWIFFFLMITSTFWVLDGVYKFYVYGSCSGLNQSGFCAFDPSGINNKVTGFDETGGTCGITQEEEKTLSIEGLDLSSFPTQNLGSEKTVFFIGCYDCEYSRNVYSDVQKLISKKKTNYIFAHYPAKSNTDFLSNVGFCVYQNNPEKYWSLNDYLFTADKDFALKRENLNQVLEKFSLDVQQINDCAFSAETEEIIKNQLTELNKTNIYGTPTIFIDQKPFVGPKPYRVYRSEINKFIFF
jgi:hypothetical protein